jgi:site-specific recombinase XerD
VNLGRDYHEAMRRFSAITEPAVEVGSLSSLINGYLVTVAPNKAPRTYQDNLKEAENLKRALGHIPYAEIRPFHVAQYRNARALDAPVRANRELALLSHVYTTAIEEGLVDFNPCRGVKRNKETARDRMIEDKEFQAVYALAADSVKILMTLIYRTGQRPEDLIKSGPADIHEIEHQGQQIRVLRVRQGKTGKTVDIVITGELEGVIDAHLSAGSVWPTFVHTQQGKPYSYSGLISMFSRYVEKAKLSNFGIYDLKAKGATDMYRSGVPLERIQHLLGHESIRTTEIYIKARLPDVSMPNMRQMGAKPNSQARHTLQGLGMAA